MKRFECLKILSSMIDPKTIVVANVGPISREWNALRPSEANLSQVSLGLCAAGVRGNPYSTDPRNRHDLMIALIASWLDMDQAEHCYIVFTKATSKDGTLSRGGMESGSFNARKRHAKLTADGRWRRISDFSVAEEINMELLEVSISISRLENIPLKTCAGAL